MADESLLNLLSIFSNASRVDSEARSSQLQEEFTNFRNTFIEENYLADYSFDVELTDKNISSLEKGKAASLDGLTARHLQFCHAVLSLTLVKLFNLLCLLVTFQRIFGQSYTVSIPKGGKAIGRSLSVDDYRGISISSVLSKIPEHCILDRFKRFFVVTSDNWFGFKKGLSCSLIIYSVGVSSTSTQKASTISICTLDLSKAGFKLLPGHFLRKVYR